MDDAFSRFRWLFSVYIFVRQAGSSAGAARVAIVEVMIAQMFWGCQAYCVLRPFASLEGKIAYSVGRGPWGVGRMRCLRWAWREVLGFRVGAGRGWLRVTWEGERLVRVSYERRTGVRGRGGARLGRRREAWYTDDVERGLNTSDVR